jgi:hypothetical protein
MDYGPVMLVVVTILMTVGMVMLEVTRVSPRYRRWMVQSDRATAITIGIMWCGGAAIILGFGLGAWAWLAPK